MTRTGKIARLPRKIRDELNRRLQDGEPGHPSGGVDQRRAGHPPGAGGHFGGRAISVQNLRGEGQRISRGAEKTAARS